MKSILADLWNVVWPIVSLLIATVGPLLVAFISKRAADLLAINGEVARGEFEKQLRDALHESAANALKLVAAKMIMAPVPVDTQLDAMKTILQNNGEALINYVKKKNPEAVDYFKLDDDGLLDIIRAKSVGVFALK